MFKVIKLPKFKYSAKMLLVWLWVVWKGNRLQAVLNAAMGLLSVGVSLAQVWAVKRAIDVASHSVEGNVYWAVGLMGLLILCDFALSVGSIWIRNVLGIRAQNRMQQRMLNRILRSEWHGREKMHSGDVLNRLENDVNKVVDFLTETLPNTLGVLAMFLGAFFYLFSMDKMLSVVIVIMIPIFLAFSKIYMNKMRYLTRLVRDSDSQVQSVLQETIQHRMLVKTLQAEKPMVEKLEETQRRLRGNVMVRTKFNVLSTFFLNFGFALGSRSLPLGSLAHGSRHPYLWWHDRLSAIGKQDTDAGAQSYQTGACLRGRVYGSRAIDGAGRESAGRAR